MKKVTTLVCVIVWCIMAVISTLQAKKNELNLLNQKVIKLYKAGKYTQAIPLAIEYMERVQARYGKNHKKFSTSLNNFALLYQSQGRYAYAEPFYARSLAIREKTPPSGSRNIPMTPRIGKTG